MNKVILEVQQLRKYFPITSGLVMAKVKGWIKAVDGVSFSLNEGETFGLVGESGCGKTTIAKLILLIERPTSGSIRFNGEDIQRLSKKELKEFRCSVQAVFQDPWSSLSPRMRVKDIVSEPIIANRSLSKKAIKDKVAEVLDIVDLSPESTELYPHEFSGGQKQRIAMARALALTPSVIVLDEPVSALDISIRAQVMNLLRDIQAQFGVSYLLIAHDLAVVRYMSSTVGVMYLGKLVEVAKSEELYRYPAHPYTNALLSAALPSHPDVEREEIILHGEVPSAINPPPGCRFHTRCFHTMPICSEVEPPLKEIANGHSVACYLYGQEVSQPW